MEIKTGQLKASWKWMQGDGWQVGRIVTDRDGLFLMRSYHTGELFLIEPERLSSYPESPIPEPGGAIMSFVKLDLEAFWNDDEKRSTKARLAVIDLENRVDSYRRDLREAYAEIDRMQTHRDESLGHALLCMDAIFDGVDGMPAILPGFRMDGEDDFDAAVRMARAFAAMHWPGKVMRLRETIDGVECERIKGLDVIVPVGLIPDGEEPADVWSLALPTPRRWISNGGSVMNRGRSLSTEYQGDLRLLLADKPAPAPVPAWTPPGSLPDGMYRWDTSRCTLLERLGSDGGGTWKDFAPYLSYRDWSYPDAQGRWQVESGRATYLGPDQEATP